LEREKINLSRQPEHVHAFIGPPNSPDLNPVAYKVWATMEQRLYQRKIHDIDELRKQVLKKREMPLGITWNSRLLTRQSISGASV